MAKALKFKLASLDPDHKDGHFKFLACSVIRGWKLAATGPRNKV